MSHNITDVDAFTSPVVVPDGTDSHSTLAEYLEGIAQPLADRTHNLNVHAAKVDVTNTFTQTQTFNVGPAVEFFDPNALNAALVTRTEADDDANAGNKWKAVLGFSIGNTGGYVNVYVGTKLGPEQFVIALNGVWDTVSQTWSSDNAAVDSLALLFETGVGVRVSKRPAGAGTWATWPTTSGDLTVGGSAFITGAMQAASAAVGPGDLNLNTGDLVYAPTRIRSSVIGSGSAQAGGHNGGNGALLTDGSRSFVYIDLRIPPNWVGGTIEIVHHQSTTTPSVFRLAERTINFASPGAASEAWPLSDTGPAASGYYLASIDVSGFTFDPDKEYRLLWYPGDGGDELEGWRIRDWQDNGPRNVL
jgi:hypothetical protein